VASSGAVSGAADFFREADFVGTFVHDSWFDMATADNRGTCGAALRDFSRGFGFVRLATGGGWAGFAEALIVRPV
jgi:hypothetical protein